MTTGVTTANYREILRQARISRGMKQDYVASKLRIAASTFCLIERGERGLSVQRFIKLLELYELTLADFEKT